MRISSLYVHLWVDIVAVKVSFFDPEKGEWPQEIPPNFHGEVAPKNIN